jgi:hypothetical protein
MSDLSESPEVDVDDAALDTPVDEKLNADLAVPEDRALDEEDASLLDAGLGETAAEEGEGEVNAGALLEESNDSVNVEDPVRSRDGGPGCELCSK